MLTDMHRLMGTHACAHICSCVHLFTQFMTTIGPPVEGGQWLGLRKGGCSHARKCPAECGQKVQAEIVKEAGIWLLRNQKRCIYP